MRKILNQFDAQGIRSSMATPSCCSCCCSCIGTLSTISSEMIIRSNDIQRQITQPDELKREDFSIWSYLTMLFVFNVPILVIMTIAPLLLHLFFWGFSVIASLVIIVLYYAFLIIYFTKKSKMKNVQYVSLLLRIALLLSIEFFVLLYVTESYGFLGIIGIISMFTFFALLEFSISMMRGVKLIDAIKQTVSIIVIPIILYLTVILLFVEHG